MTTIKGYVKRTVHTFVSPPPVETRYKPLGQLFYIKACNGAGKSTIPSYLSSTDPEAFVVTYFGRVILTVCPSYGMLLFGKYDKSKSKGVDSLKDYDEMKLAVEMSEMPEFASYDAIFEGVIPSTILHTWVEYLDRPSRKLYTAFIDTPLEECLSRICKRNGGSDFNESLVIEKFKRVNSHRERHNSLFPAVPGVMIRSHGITIKEMVELFLNRQFGSID